MTTGESDKTEGKDMNLISISAQDGITALRKANMLFSILQQFLSEGVIAQLINFQLCSMVSHTADLVCQQDA